MKNIHKFLLLILAVIVSAGCSKTFKVDDADASFVAHKLDGDKVRLSSSSEALTVELFTKTIDGVDQQIAYVEFEFTGSGDHTTVWTGDSCTVHVPKKVDGSTGDITEWQDLRFASDYERYKANDFTQKGRQLSNGKLIYTYWKPGTYKATMVATNWGEMDSDEMSRDEKSITITVVE